MYNCHYINIMHVAVLTDTHDNVDGIDQARKVVAHYRCRRIFFCGDLCSPSSLLQLAKFGLPLDVVFGNNDGDRFSMGKAVQGLKNVTLHGEFADLKIGKRHIFLTHFPVFAEHAAAVGRYDAVFFGHVHGMSIVRKVSQTLFAHPGSLKRGHKMSCGIYDTAKNHFEIVEIGV
jgi:uncharacterized protein